MAEVLQWLPEETFWARRVSVVCITVWRGGPNAVHCRSGTNGFIQYCHLS